jgi:hypothetical protein
VVLRLEDSQLLLTSLAWGRFNKDGYLDVSVLTEEGKGGKRRKRAELLRVVFICLVIKSREGEQGRQTVNHHCKIIN